MERKSKIIKWLLYYVLSFCTIILLCSVILLILLTMEPGERFLKGVLEDRLGSYLNMNVSVSDLETNLTSRLGLKEISISSSAGPDGRQFLKVENLNIHYNIWSLLKKEINVSEIAVDGLNADLHRNRVGLFDIPFLDSVLADTAAPEEQPSEFKLNLGSLNLKNFNVVFTDDSLSAGIKLHNLSTTVITSGDNKYDYRFSIDSINISYDSLVFIAESLASGGGFDSSLIKVDDFHTLIEKMELNGGAIIKLDETADFKAGLTLNGKPDKILSTLKSWYEIPEVSFKEPLQIHLSISGPADRPSARVAIDLPSMTIDNINVSNCHVDVGYSGDTLSIDSCRLNAFDGRLALKGQVTLDSLMQTELAMTLGSLNLAAIWSSIYNEKSPYSGKINAGIKIVGQGDNPSDYAADVDFNASGLSYEKQALPDLRGSIVYKEDNLGLHINHEIFRIHADAILRDDHIKGQYSVEVDDLEPLAGLFNITELNGRFYSSGNFTGELESPEISAAIGLGNVSYRNFPLDTLAAEIDYKNEDILIKALTFSGRIDSVIPETAPFNMDQFSARMTYSGTAAGKLDSLFGKIDIEMQNPSYDEYSCDSVKAGISGRGTQIRLDKLSVYRDNHSLQARGIFDLDSLAGQADLELFEHFILSVHDSTETLSPSTEPISPDRSLGRIECEFALPDSINMDLSLTARDINLEIINPYLQDSFNVSGKIDLETIFSGNLDNPKLKLTSKVRKLVFNEIGLDSITADINFEDSYLNVDQIGIHGYGQQLLAEASVELKPDTAYYFALDETCLISGRLECTDFDLEVLKPVMVQVNDLSGICNIDISWNGTVSAPGLNGTITVDKGYILLDPEYGPVEQVNIKTEITDSVLVINKFAGIIQHNPFDISGFVHAVPPDYLKTDLFINFTNFGGASLKGTASKELLDLEISVDSFNISVLEPLVPKIKELKGIAVCDIRIGGSPEDPVVSGDLAVDQINFRQKSIPELFSDGVVKISFDNDRVNIDSIFVRLGQGTIFAAGELKHDMAEIVDIDFSINVDSIRLLQPKEYLFEIISVDLKYTKPGDDFLLDGDIVLGDTRLLYGFRPQSILPWVQTVEQTELDLPEFLMQTRMNVRIRESDKLWVDNNLAKIRLRANLGIIGSPYRPNFSGRVNIEEGYILYLDRRFNIETGDILFYDPTQFNPEINLKARAKITSYRGMQSTPYDVIFSAEGLLDELKIALYSEPPLEKPDIIALLTFGSTRSQLAGRDSDTKGILKERAEMLTSKQISSYISRKAGSFLGLDEMTVEGNIFRSDRNGGPQLLASKMISKRARLTYTTTVGHMNDQSIRLDYYLSRRFSLMGQTDRIGRSSIDLKYGVRFR